MKLVLPNFGMGAIVVLKGAGTIVPLQGGFSE